MTHEEALAKSIELAYSNLEASALWLDIAREIRILSQAKQRAEEDAAYVLDQADKKPKKKPRDDSFRPPVKHYKKMRVNV